MKYFHTQEEDLTELSTHMTKILNTLTSFNFFQIFIQKSVTQFCLFIYSF